MFDDGSDPVKVNEDGDVDVLAVLPHEDLLRSFKRRVLQYKQSVKLDTSVVELLELLRTMIMCLEMFEKTE